MFKVDYASVVLRFYPLTSTHIPRARISGMRFLVPLTSSNRTSPARGPRSLERKRVWGSCGEKFLQVPIFLRRCRGLLPLRTSVITEKTNERKKSRRSRPGGNRGIRVTYGITVRIVASPAVRYSRTAAPMSRFYFATRTGRKSTRIPAASVTGEERRSHKNLSLVPAAAATEVIDIPREGTCPLFSATGASIVRFVNSPFAVSATTR